MPTSGLEWASRAEAAPTGGPLPGARASPVCASIGPNAITRVAEALNDLEHRTTCDCVFRKAGLRHHLVMPPTAMVPDEDVAALHRALHDELGAVRADVISRRAGKLTAAYLLAHRIPPPVQTLLRWLPRGAALRILLRAIARHSWTFSGAGIFAYSLGHPADLSLKGGPIARRLTTHDVACSYYAATFEGIFRSILGSDIQVTERACQAQGASACLFELTW